ncbi:transposase family protein [Mycobacterium sp.]|uniref:transposase family protein n=1 Tax=Mycobacterium sp. TaxID=1785 RepID=UPI0031DB50DC
MTGAQGVAKARNQGADANPTRHERLLQALQTVPDPRDPRGVRYPLEGVLALAVTATFTGCRSFAAVGQWAAETAVDNLALFGLTSGSAPDESTLRELFARIDWIDFPPRPKSHSCAAPSPLPEPKPSRSST